MLLDLADERRAGKPGLPTSDLDVTEGRVVADPGWGGRPDCTTHGAMNQIAPAAEDGHRLFRCYGCGVGAIWYPANTQAAKAAFSRAWDDRVRRAR